MWTFVKNAGGQNSQAGHKGAFKKTWQEGVRESFVARNLHWRRELAQERADWIKVYRRDPKWSCESWLNKLSHRHIYCTWMHVLVGKHVHRNVCFYVKLMSDFISVKAMS